MPRKAAPKPISEHIATLAKVQQAVQVEPKLAKRAKKISQALGLAMSEMQAEVGK